MQSISEKDVIYEDNHIIVVNKPAGIPVQGDETGDVSLFDMVKEYIRVKYNKPGEAYLGLVHRIDRPVSGLVLFARTSKAASRMSETFREREIEKTYLAIVEKQPPALSGTIKSYIWKDKDANRAYSYQKEKKGSKLAILDYRQLEEVNGSYLIEVKPHTGRSHQIRAQLSALGCPIVGDSKYGSKIQADRAICLHARQLKFMHPVKKSLMEVMAPVPRGRFWQKFSLEGS